MDDIYEYTSDRKWRLCVWETNKASTWGWYKWKVQEYLPDLNHWYTHAKYERFLHYEDALDAARHAMYLCVEGGVSAYNIG